MSKKIRSYEEFLEMKGQLESDLAISRELIRQDIEILREEWKPVTNVISGLGKFTTKGKTNPLLAIGVDILGDLLVRRVLLARAGWITRIVVPFLVKNYSTHVIGEKGPSFVRKMVDRFINHRSNGRLISND